MIATKDLIKKEKVFVYRNLKKDTFSVKSKTLNRVVKHSDYIVIKNPKFKVSEAGRQRVLKEKRKNVHAGIEGWEDPLSDLPDLKTYSRVTYNPYKCGCFTYKHSSFPITEASVAICTPDGVYIK